MKCLSQDGMWERKLRCKIMKGKLRVYNDNFNISFNIVRSCISQK